MNYAIHPSQGGYFSEPLVRITRRQVLPGTASKWEVSKTACRGRSRSTRARCGPTATRSRQRTTSTPSSTRPNRACVGLHVLLGWRHQELWPRHSRRGARQRGRHQAGRQQVRVRGHDRGADAVPADDDAVLVAPEPDRARRSTAPASTTSTRPRPSSSGPFILDEWSPDRRVVLKANPKYTGKLKPLINGRVANTVTGGSALARYRAGEVDYVLAARPRRPDLKEALADPTLADQIKINPGDFRTLLHLLRHHEEAVRRRQGANGLRQGDRPRSIVKGDPRPDGPAGLLVPRCRASRTRTRTASNPSRTSTPAAAKKLLADAGYCGWRRLPEADPLVRGGGPSTDAALTQAVVASITQTLGVQIDLQTMDRPAFSRRSTPSPPRSRSARSSYGYDYLDASNMLNIWKTGGRHNYNNATYDKMVADASVITDDPAKRTQMMQDAEKMLVTDAPGAFLYHELRRSCTSRTARVRTSTSRARPATPASTQPAKAPAATPSTRCTTARTWKRCGRRSLGRIAWTRLAAGSRTPSPSGPILA